MIFFPECFEIPSFCNYIAVHIPKNHRYTQGNNEGLKKLEILVHIFLYFLLAKSFGIMRAPPPVKKHLPRNTFSEIMNQIA